MAGDKGTVTKIDTKNFDDAITGFENAVKIYRAARERVFDSTEKLLYDWEGEGKDSFEKQYSQLKTKLKDEEDNLVTIKEDLEECRQSYVDWDTQLAEQLKPPVVEQPVAEKPNTAPLGGSNNPLNVGSNNPFNGGGYDPFKSSGVNVGN